MNGDDLEDALARLRMKLETAPLIALLVPHHQRAKKNARRNLLAA
jgi:hypothetical protein